jgi:DinB superfamily
MELARVVAVLDHTPSALEGLLSGLPDELTAANEGGETYSPRDVLGHLVFGEETDWVPRIRIILEDGESRPFTPFDREGFRAYGGEPVKSLLARFRALREKNLGYLRGLDLQPEQMGTRGTHPGLGSVTLGQLLASWAVHDLGHVAQASRVVAKQFRADVGPWDAYLTILAGR